MGAMERYPTPDLLKLLANILTHIAHSNDQNSSTIIAPDHSNTQPFTLTSAARSVLGPTAPSINPNVPLTFHARNVPTISLESYLLRILKYCPTSNFVFLSLLVYFDRMAALSLASGAGNTSKRLFHVDSYNVHRLVIAGITVASKFFSDVFYTNSRYAKVGGLPLPELNQLELQFLLLNDFRLVISPRQMLIYSQHLITFSIEHPPPSISPLDISVLAATLGTSAFPAPAPSPPPPPPPPVVVLPSTTTTIQPTSTFSSSSSSSSPHSPPSSPPLRPSSSPSPSPSNSSSSSLRSSPSASPRPPRMIMTNGHLTHNPNPPRRKVRHSSRPIIQRQPPIPNPNSNPNPDSDEGGEDDSDEDEDDDDDDDSDDDSDKADAETLTSTSTDDDSEPTIRGPRTVVGWEADVSRKSP